MRGRVFILLFCFSLLGTGCGNEGKIANMIESDSIIREYIDQWQADHPNFLIKSKVAKVDDKCLCYAMEFIKKEEEKAGFFEKLKTKVRDFEDKKYLKSNIEYRIKVILPQGWHVYVEEGEDACRWRCE